MTTRSVFLEELTWAEAEPILRLDPLVVIPVGAGAKEHGPHLPLGTDASPPSTWPVVWPSACRSWCCRR
jgi:hypothetical protein